MLAKIYSFLASFFWGNWFLRVVQTVLMFTAVASVLIAIFSFLTVLQGELGILAIAPLIFFLCSFFVNAAFLLWLRKIKNNPGGSSGVVAISLSAFVCVPTLFILISLGLYMLR